MIQRTLFLIAVVLCPFGLAWAEDWPQWRGPDRTGVSKETGLLQSWPPEGPKLLWIYRDAGIGLSSMSVVGDRLYSMGGEGHKEYVYAIDLKTQKKLWSVEVGALYVSDFDDAIKFGYGPQSTPAIDGNFLYAIGGLGNLVCVETVSGRKVWSQGLLKDLGGVPTRWGYCESPLVDGDQVVVTPGGKKGAIAAFDKKTGTLKWRTTAWPDSASFSSMIAIESGGVRQYVQIPGSGRKDYKKQKTIIGVRASDGKLLWSFPLPSTLMIATPIYKNDCIYTCSAPAGGKSCLIKLIHDGDKFKAEMIYETNKMLNSLGGGILSDDYLYSCHFPGHGSVSKLICQNFKTGKIAWDKTEDRMIGVCGSIVLADGNLYCYHESGDMLLIKASLDGYKIQGKFRIPEKTKLPRNGAEIWTHPVVANGKLYLRDQDLIFCYDIHKPREARLAPP